MQKKISIFEIKKYLNKKGFIVKKKKKIETQKSGLDNLSRTFLSSLIIISIFFIAPLAINLTKEKTIFSKDYENNSKNNLKKLLENKTTKLDEKLNKKFLYEDILTFDERPSDVILLSAAALNNMTSDGRSSNVKISSYKNFLFNFSSSFVVLFSNNFFKLFFELFS